MTFGNHKEDAIGASEVPSAKQREPKCLLRDEEGMRRRKREERNEKREERKERGKRDGGRIGERKVGKKRERNE